MQENKPFISVVVPSYNRADLIGRTLKSLQRQEYDRYEIIVVDDGSTDNTEEVVRGIADKRTSYRKKVNAERAAARNFGAGIAKGDYVNFFDSDDLALPNHLSEAAKLIQELNHPEWFHLGFAWATPDDRIIRNIDNFKVTTLNSIMAKGNPLSCNGVFVRKDIILSNPFNEDRVLSASEDYELWLRLAARYPLYYSNTVTSWVVDHDSRSVRTINGKKLIDRLLLLLKHINNDQQAVHFFGSDLKMIKADAYSYIALHLADVIKYKGKSILFLFASIIAYPGITGKKRFYAILKNLIIKWQSS
jgi:glycosyltransferase involved in cell wall biosynthesis